MRPTSELTEDRVFLPGVGKAKAADLGLPWRFFGAKSPDFASSAFRDHPTKSLIARANGNSPIDEAISKV